MREHFRAIALDPLTLRRNLAGYSRGDLNSDLRAGMNVALLAFPQGMAYALLAGLPIYYGIYCSAIAAMVGPCLASSRLAVIGPTNATAVMLLSVLITLPAGMDRLACISLLVFMVGLVLVVGAFVRFATLIKFISRSVIIGYITGAALLIGVNQLHHVMGTQVAGASTFLDICRLTVLSVPQANWAAIILGVLTFACIWASRKWLKALPGVALTLILMSFLAAVMQWAGFPVKLLDSLPVGQWPITPPEMNFSWFSVLVGPAMAIAFLATLENMVMAKSLASRAGHTINPNQEMLSLGAANIASGFFGGMPASGSLTRSALNASSGATSPLSSIFSGMLCAVGALTLGPLVGFIPVPVLAAVVIAVAATLIDFRSIRVALKSTKSDATVFVVTFSAAILTPLDVAIFLGVATSIALYLHKSSTPQLVEYSFNDEGNLCEVEERRDHPSISIIHVEGELYFGAADLFRDEIRRVCQDPNLRIVVLRLRNAHHLDATSVFALEELIDFLRSNGRDLVISGARKDVYRVLRNSGLLDHLGKENLFMGSPQNPNLSTRKALKRAQEIMGGEKADVRIFYDPGHAKSQTA